MAKGERIEDILKGRRTTCEGIEYYRVKTFIEDLRIPITEYLEAHIADWQTGRIKSRQNQDFYIPLDKVGFYDIDIIIPAERTTAQARLTAKAVLDGRLKGEVIAREAKLVMRKENGEWKIHKAETVEVFR